MTVVGVFDDVGSVFVDVVLSVVISEGDEEFNDVSVVLVSSVGDDGVIDGVGSEKSDVVVLGSELLS